MGWDNSFLEGQLVSLEFSVLTPPPLLGTDSRPPTGCSKASLVAMETRSDHPPPGSLREGSEAETVASRRSPGLQSLRQRNLRSWTGVAQAEGGEEGAFQTVLGREGRGSEGWLGMLALSALCFTV